MGLNTTGMLVDPFAGTIIGAAGVGSVKLEENVKSVGLLPPKDNPVNRKSALPGLVIVKFNGALAVPTGWFANVSGLGAILINGAVPVPLKGTLWGLLFAVSAITRDADREPVAAGWKLTERVVVPPLAATVIGDAGVGNTKFAGNRKSPGFTPPNARPLMSNGALPVFVIVMLEAALVEPSD
jgi:hypothetical protein